MLNRYFTYNQKNMDTSHFSNEMKAVQSSHTMHRIATYEAMEVTAASLPIEFLIKHKMFKYVKRIAADKFQRVIYIIRLKILHHGFQKIVNFTLALMKAKSNLAVLLISRVVFRYIYRRRLKKYAAEELMRANIQRDIELKSEIYYLSCVILIQSIIRAFLCRNILKERRLIFTKYNLAAKCIQKRYRRYIRIKHGGMIFYQAVDRYLEQIIASTIIQRVYRGFLGRLKCQLVRVAKYRYKNYLTI